VPTAQVKRSYSSGLNSRNVSESHDNTIVLSVDDRRESSVSLSSFSEPTFSGSPFLGLENLGNISMDTKSMQSRATGSGTEPQQVDFFFICLKLLL
jgi:hypothetical protein